MTGIGIAFALALIFGALDADAGNARKQQIKLPETCYLLEASDDPEAPPVRAEVLASERYQLVARYPGGVYILSEFRCADGASNRIIEINATWPLAIICGRTDRFPDGCAAVKTPP